MRVEEGAPESDGEEGENETGGRGGGRECTVWYSCRRPSIEGRAQRRSSERAKMNLSLPPLTVSCSLRH